MALIKFALIAIILAFVMPASAGPAADALSVCLTDNTTGKDRKDLMRWLFAAMSTHPEMRELSSATAAQRDRASEAVGVLFTQLMSERCSGQFRDASRTEGTNSLRSAFEALGRLAMLELTSNADVTRAISDFERFVDKKKIEAALVK